jgi:hypothetical protein
MSGLKDTITDAALKAAARILTGGSAPVMDIVRTAYPQIDQIREAHARFSSDREKDVTKVLNYRSHLEQLGVTSEPVLVTADLFGKLNSNYVNLYSKIGREAGDTLRLGDSMRDPTVMNVLKDTGRATVIAETLNEALGAGKVLVN